MMKVPVSRIVSFAAMLAGPIALLSASGCVSYGNTRALITPVGVAGYHTFKPTEPVRDIPQDPNRIAAAKPKQQQSPDSET